MELVFISLFLMSRSLVRLLGIEKEIRLGLVARLDWLSVKANFSLLPSVASLIYLFASFFGANKHSQTVKFVAEIRSPELFFFKKMKSLNHIVLSNLMLLVNGFCALKDCTNIMGGADIVLWFEPSLISPIFL